MGTDFERFAVLQDALNERAEFHRQGLERINKYYTLPEHERKEKTGLRDSPHEIFMKRAGETISLGFKIKELLSMHDEGVGMTLVGVGTEILLKAIIYYLAFLFPLSGHQFKL